MKNRPTAPRGGVHWCVNVYIKYVGCDERHHALFLPLNRGKVEKINKRIYSSPVKTSIRLCVLQGIGGRSRLKNRRPHQPPG